MVSHLLSAFRTLFTTRRGRVAVGTLVVVMAAVPVAEMLVIRMFSTLITDGPDMLDEDRAGVITAIVVFFAAMAATRGIQHLAKFQRVRVFRTGFEASPAKRTPSQESWEYALAFELSGVLVSLVQVLTFSVLFIVVDWQTGLVNALICALVLAAVSVIFRRQLGLQRGYAKMGGKPGSTAISERVGGRIRDAEIGSLLASVALMAALGLVLVRVLGESVDPADAIVLFLGLRLLYGQLASLSGAMMRFARASARREG